MIAVGLVATVPAHAQLSDLLKGWFDGEDAGESSPSAESAQDKGPCPDSASHFQAAQLWPQSCGKVRPPAVAGAPKGGLATLEGVWDIELRGEKGVREMVGLLSKGLTGVGFRTENSDWAFVGTDTGPTDALELPFVSVGGWGKPDAVTERGVILSYGGVRMSVRKSGGGNVMIGQWSDRTNSGVAVWRKRPPHEIDSVEFVSARVDASGRYAKDVVTPGTRPGRIEGQHPVSCGYGHMRGNCPKVSITIRGRFLAGPHEVWIDPAEHFEFLESGSHFLFHGGASTDVRNLWVLPARRAVTGLQLNFVLWDGATPGPKALWFDGQPIPFEFVVHGYPDDEQKPDMLALQALGADAAKLEKLVEGEPFRLRAEFEAEHPDPWLTVDLPVEERITQLDAPLGSGESSPAAPVAARSGSRAVLWRADDPRIFESDWLAIKAGEREESR